MNADKQAEKTELRTILLVAAVQFINVLDFMMVMPLGPDFSKALGIPTSTLGYIGGSYTAAAFVAGLAGSFFLDRFDRRKVLAIAMTGLVIGTALGGFATGLYSLIAARIVAGLFGGPATSISLSIISDVVPPERRGRAMGITMSAFSLSSIFGVPAGLKLSQWGGWRLPFFSVAALGVVIVALAVASLPPLVGHLRHRANGGDASSFMSVLSRPLVRMSYTMTFISMVGLFMLIPNISAFVQGNLHFPREHMDQLYGAGGLTSLIAMRVMGKLVDRFGSFRIGAIGSSFLIVVVWFGFASPLAGLPVYLLFVGFMLASSFRNVAVQTVTSKVPRPMERARFTSMQSAVQHLASSVGAFTSAKILHEVPITHELLGIDTIAKFTITTSLVALPLLYFVEKGVKAEIAKMKAMEPSGEAVPAA